MRQRRFARFVVSIVSLTAITCHAWPAHARWPQAQNQVLTLAPGGRDTGVQDACPDGAGGSFVCWGAGSPGGNLFIQHLDAFGNEVFASGPWVADTLAQRPINLAPDGAGGVVALAEHWPSGASGVALGLHRITASGERLWATPFWLGTPPGVWKWTGLAAGLSGEDWTAAWLAGGPTPDTIRAQRIDASGHTLWGDTGIVVASSAYALRLGPMAVDGSGGVWVAFMQVSNPRSVRIQYVRADGSLKWPEDGVVVEATPYLSDIWQLVADGADGAWISWSLQNAPDGSDRVQRIRADGSLALGPDGLVLPGTSPLRRGLPALGAASGGRAFVAWQAEVGSYSWTTRVQLLDSTGTWLWPGNGVPLANDYGESTVTRIFTHADGGATVTVHPTQVYGALIGAQRVAADGTLMWPAATPLAVIGDASQRYYADEIGGLVSDGNGGVTYFVTFADSGMGFQRDAYHVRAQHLDGHGRHGDTAPRIVALRDTPDDTGGWLEVRWHASSLEGDATMPTTTYEVLRAQPDGTGGTTLNVVAEQAATGDTEYVELVPTQADSTSPSSPPTVIRVRARDAAGHAWLSPQDSASSYANSPPLAVGRGDALGLALAAPEPSPASAFTRIRYTLPADMRVSLVVFDATGRRIRTLAHGAQAAGEHVVTLNPASDGTGRLAPGLYFVRLEVPGRTFTRRLVVLR